VSGPLQAAWINQKLDSRVCATIHSCSARWTRSVRPWAGPSSG
jgi:hypothetical protein